MYGKVDPFWVLRVAVEGYAKASNQQQALYQCFCSVLHDELLFSSSFGQPSEGASRAGCFAILRKNTTESVCAAASC
jgi:hypothetical protein